jgi:aryl-alcohol dehydrogenase-like predicted oxidoreductase
VTSVITGASAERQIEANALAGSWALSQEEVVEVQTILEGREYGPRHIRTDGR